MQQKRSSNLFLGITVYLKKLEKYFEKMKYNKYIPVHLPHLAAGMHLDGAVFNCNEALDKVQTELLKSIFQKT
jgi:hypothetical protein